MTIDNTNRTIDIIPETKVGDLIKNYPQLEDELIRLAPVFAKLKNPILRKTVARVATLRQAAQVGNIQIGHLINSLRQAAGVGESIVSEDVGKTGLVPKPEWLNEMNIAVTFDSREMIARGNQSLGHVMKELRKLNPGQIYKLVTPFYPAPLIDKVKSDGFEVWSITKNKETVETFIHRVNSA
jgi:uncharacterized protein (DUF2249 family)